MGFLAEKNFELHIEPWRYKINDIHEKSSRKTFAIAMIAALVLTLFQHWVVVPKRPTPHRIINWLVITLLGPLTGGLTMYQISIPPK